ncbi:MAG: hypothetical protein A2Y62_13375 [Candidatus Fischerbacteria bacterium RBG_13_37_8]|uniref:Bifunctional protein FolD n=1 Tax=Candidatus Fischerbacteria bacterium RBG_13_37_8 TaxID=1817863 RepID=A0A1F5VJJ8_9BACT|nr:MAG: hypothetical protein A2Y62_13375 [Candidatus Fischerbacteria bacterium RBG_13_37_8]
MPQKNNPVKLDGTLLAEKLTEAAKNEVEKLRKKNIVPHLEVILVGNDPASRIYVNNKTKACDKTGIFHNTNLLPENVSNEELLKFIQELNSKKEVNGILVQLPLPPQIKKDKIIDAIDPIKDVDGLHPYNMGLLMAGRQQWNPCTPGGILSIFKEHSIPLEGKNCVIIGRSDIVGKPLSLLLMQQNATVTICHSKTKNIPELLKKADIVCAAIGKAAFVKPDFIEQNTIIIDVGVNRISEEKLVDEIFGKEAPQKETFQKRGSCLCGDVHPQAYTKSSYYTPVPGGVGPMTIATLINNTITAAKVQKNSQ